MALTVGTNFAQQIIARHTTFLSLVPYAADLVLLETPEGESDGGTTILRQQQNIRHIHNCLEQNTVVSLDLNLSFLNVMIDRAVRQISVQQQSAAKMLAHPLQLERDPGSSVVRIDRPATQVLLRETAPAEAEEARTQNTLLIREKELLERSLKQLTLQEQQKVIIRYPEPAQQLAGARPLVLPAEPMDQPVFPTDLVHPEPAPAEAAPRSSQEERGTPTPPAPLLRSKAEAAVPSQEAKPMQQTSGPARQEAQPIRTAPLIHPVTEAPEPAQTAEQASRSTTPAEARTQPILPVSLVHQEQETGEPSAPARGEMIRPQAPAESRAQPIRTAPLLHPVTEPAAPAQPAAEAKTQPILPVSLVHQEQETGEPSAPVRRETVRPQAPAEPEVQPIRTAPLIQPAAEPAVPAQTTEQTARTQAPAEAKAQPVRPANLVHPEPEQREETRPRTSSEAKPRTVSPVRRERDRKETASVQPSAETRPQPVRPANLVHPEPEKPGPGSRMERNQPFHPALKENPMGAPERQVRTDRPSPFQAEPLRPAPMVHPEAEKPEAPAPAAQPRPISRPRQETRPLPGPEARREAVTQPVRPAPMVHPEAEEPAVIQKNTPAGKILTQNLVQPFTQEHRNIYRLTQTLARQTRIIDRALPVQPAETIQRMAPTVLNIPTEVQSTPAAPVTRVFLQEQQPRTDGPQEDANGVPIIPTIQKTVEENDITRSLRVTENGISTTPRQSSAGTQSQQPVEIPDAEINRITKKVYRAIEDRLRSEKLRRGMW